MRTLPAAIIARFGDHRIRAPFLLEILGGAVPLHWTDAPFSITYGGNTYVQQWFDVGDIVVDSDGNEVVELVFPDVDRIIRGLLFAEDWSFRPATLRTVWLDDDRSIIDAYIVADGRADGGRMNFEDESEPVTISIAPDTDAEGSPGPAQEYSYACRYVDKFKGLQCAYSGPGTTCDGTVAQCTAYGNMARYGGFPFAPTPGTKIKVGGGTDASASVVQSRTTAAPPTSSKKRAVRH